MDEIPDDSERLSAAAAAAQARREARMKRILENSKNRLSKITGREENDVPEAPIKKESERIIYPDPEIERDVYEFEAPFIPMGTPEPDIDIFQLLNNLKPQNGQPPSTAPQQMAPTSKMTKFLRTKIHFAVLAVLTYVMVATDTLVTRNIFLMFLLWEAAEVFLLKTYEVNKTSFIGILFMLGGIPAIHSTAIIKFMETAVKILNDVAVFVFYFVVSHILWKLFVMGSTFDSITNFEAI
ncbi:hypothetical protein HA402_013164 [Bradysia odoriphaga]|nr:hypothetical protein HA402_013164 [Bradysia odoriphaga]